MTTGTLQQLIYLERRRLHGRAVIVGAEHVSYSALLTLMHAGVRPVAMITEHPRHQTLAAFHHGAALFRTPLHTRTVIDAISGSPRLEAVTLRDLDTRRRTVLGCEVLVFTADWIPDHELAVVGGVPLDPDTRGPVVDAALRTRRPGLFAAGNVLHGAETADICALEGRHVARCVAAYLAGGGGWPAPGAKIACDPPLAWIAPNAAGPPGQAPPRGHYLLRAREELARPRVALTQDGRRLADQRFHSLRPGRSARLYRGWEQFVDPRGGPVRVHVVSARRPRTSLGDRPDRLLPLN